MLQSHKLISFFTLAVGIMGLMSSKSIAQDPSICFLIDLSGQYRDLSEICGKLSASQTSLKQPSLSNFDTQNINLSDQERPENEVAEDGLTLQTLQNEPKAEIIPKQCSAAALKFDDGILGWQYVNNEDRKNPCLNQQYQHNEQYIQRLSYRTSPQIYQGYYNRLDNLCRQSDASTCDRIDSPMRNRLETNSVQQIGERQQRARGFRFLR